MCLGLQIHSRQSLCDLVRNYIRIWGADRGHCRRWRSRYARDAGYDDRVDLSRHWVRE